MFFCPFPNKRGPFWKSQSNLFWPLFLRYLSASAALLEVSGPRSTIDLKFLYRSAIAARRTRPAQQCSSSLSSLCPHSTSEILPREMPESLANSYCDNPVSSRSDFRPLLKFSNPISGNLALVAAKQHCCLLSR